MLRELIAIITSKGRKDFDVCCDYGPVHFGKISHNCVTLEEF